MLNIFINLLLAVHILVCVLIVLAVLMQRPKNEGLGAAFGGGMTESLFGAETTNVLATVTRWLGVLFFGLTLLLSALYARQGRLTTNVQQRLGEAPKPVTPPVDLKPAEVTPVSAEEKKVEAPSPVPAPEAPKTQEVKPEPPKADAAVPVPPKAPEVPATELPKAATPEKAPAVSPEATKVDESKENSPILKVPAPELNPATPAPATAPKPSESAQ